MDKTAMSGLMEKKGADEKNSKQHWIETKVKKLSEGNQQPKRTEYLHKQRIAQKRVYISCKRKLSFCTQCSPQLLP